MKRTIQRELLEAASPEEARVNLRDLVRINRWLGGHQALLSMMRQVAGREEEFTVLDAGAASGDMGAALMRAFPRARVTSLDRAAVHLESAPKPSVVADAFVLPFREDSFDFVMANLFLHHFEDEDIETLFHEFARVARRAVLVVDLWRHPLPRLFLPATRRLFGWQALTVHDGVRSVEAGFTKRELECAARAAGLSGVRVRRHLPWFRLTLSGGVRRS